MSEVSIPEVMQSPFRIKKWPIVVSQIRLHKSKQKPFEFFRDSAKMDFKSSENCRRVKLAALGERGLESCTLRCC